MTSVHIAGGSRNGSLRTRSAGNWTREAILDALRRYERTHGRVTSASFNPATAKWASRPDLVEVYYGPTGPWPSLNTIRAHFGSFNAAREAAGLPPNRPGPRRGVGEAAPIRDVRERRVFVPDARIAAANARAGVAEGAAARALRRAERAELALAELRARRKAHEVVVPRTRVEVREKIKTKTVRVRDERVIKRLRERLADERARTKASDDQAKATLRDLDRAVNDAERASLAAAGARRDAAEVERERDVALDRLAAQEAREVRLRSELEETRAEASGVAERAATAGLVRMAEARADEAEIRVARAEREMREQAEAITGEARRLTAVELAELRQGGPSGPAVLAVGLKRLAKARALGGAEPLASALVEVASAAIRWRDRL